MKCGYKTVVLLSICLFFTGSSSFGAPAASVWKRWLAYDAQATQVVDHGPWSRFLEIYLVSGKNGINRLDYGGVTRERRSLLDGYLSELSFTVVSALNRKEQLAYWINLYNALTVKVVLDHFPVDSIRDIDISPGFFSDGPWGKKLITVEGEPVSLDDIEHRILRPIWKDSRIHYAVNCASLGCPNLQPVAYTAENIDRLLVKAAREYINHPRGVRFDGGKLVVSSIYRWFAEDFGSSDENIIMHLRTHAEPVRRGQLKNARQLSGYDYDWSLNGIR